MLKDQKILITGGAGFIASHLIELLIDKNQVIVYDNYTRDSLSLSQHLLENKNLTIVKGDVLDLENLTTCSMGVNIVVHCAAIAGIYSVSNHPAKTMKTNLIGSFNVLEAARENHIKRIIDFSTSEVYGSFVYRGKETDNTVIGAVGDKRWVYAVGKLASEHLMHAYGQEFDLDITSVRPFNVYGPRQTGEGAIQQMILHALEGKDLTVYNDGVQVRAWCYVTDFVDALYQILGSQHCKNQVFNIGNPKTSITVLGLAEKIISMTQSKSKIVFRKHPGTDIEVRIPDIHKIQELLNFYPKINLEEGLSKTIQWYKGYLERR